jgi:hypothetical protein
VDQLHVFRNGQMLGRYELHATELVLGRGGHIVLDGPGVSRLHALLSHHEGRGFVITDLGSRNGTWVNGASITEAVLKTGDEVTLGDYAIRCAFDGSNPVLRAPPIAAREGLDDTQELRAGPQRAGSLIDHPAMDKSKSESARRLRVSANKDEASKTAGPTPAVDAKAPEPKPDEPKKDDAKKDDVKKDDVKKDDAKKDDAKKDEAKKDDAKKDAPKKDAPKKDAKKDAGKREAVGEDVRRAYETYFVRLRRLVRHDVDPTKEVKPTQVDLKYHARPSDWRRRLRRLSVAASIVAMAWIGVALGRNDRTLFTSSAVSSGHQVFGNDCARCHVQPFTLRVPDAACLDCHQGLLSGAEVTALAAVTSAQKTDPAGFAAASWSTHHAAQSRTLDCASCHMEHGGSPILATAVTDRHCTTCHGDLASSVSAVASLSIVGPAGHAVPSFDRHPEFAPLLPVADRAKLPADSSARRVSKDGDRARLFLDHARHMAPQLSAMESPGRQAWLKQAGRDHMECADCHQPDATRDHFQPIRYEQHCAGCHPLSLRTMSQTESDAAFQAEHPLAQPKPVPHGLDPAELARWVRGARLDDDARRFYEDYARAHEAERAPREDAPSGPRRPGPPRRPGGGGDKPAAPQTEAEWVKKRMARWEERGAGGALEDLLFAELADGCIKCHRLASNALGVSEAAADAPTTGAASRQALLEKLPAGHGAALLEKPADAPSVRPTQVPARWLDGARFSHTRHEVLGCLDCHAGATASKETSDVLLPGIASCVGCHHDGGGGAVSRCTTCHDYHDHGRGSMDGPLSRGALVRERHP